ncbi:hypothetical protein Dimus_022254, partial [Dionaea muscipula]
MSGGVEASDIKSKKIIGRKKGTTNVAFVEGEEIPIEGTVGGTQESEVVFSKGKTKRKSQPKKKDIISPALGENEVE